MTGNTPLNRPLDQNAVPDMTPQQEATARQKLAARPDLSAWVAASAGSGKTRVLTDRALRLMLAGSQPDRILCLTYTKAAAAEMSNRLAARLSDWATCDRADLLKAVEDLTGEPVTELTERRARSLFARMLDAPGGMKVQTLHSFCQALLRRFPLEAGIAPHFEIADERSSGELLAAARERLLIRARRGEALERDGIAPIAPEDAANLGLVRDLRLATGQLAEQGFNELLKALIGERGRLERFRAGRACGEDDTPLLAAIAGAFGVSEEADPQKLLQAACQDDACCARDLRHVAQVLLASKKSKTDIAKGEKLATWLALPPEDRPEAIDLLFAVFFTKGGKGDPYAALATKAVVENHPDIVQAMQTELKRLQNLRTALNSAILVQGTCALVRLARAQEESFRRSKARRAVLDYDDQILLARSLLTSRGGESWVSYKLDDGIEHILIDEAQDTNPEQWDLVEALTGSFFAGEGAQEDRRDRDMNRLLQKEAAQGGEDGALTLPPPPPPRSVFAVGDAKQSIYSFQRADPAGFFRMRDYFAGLVPAGGGQWENVSLQVSFRSAPPILQLVDAVFASPELARGAGENQVRHSPVRATAPGVIEIWPPVQNAVGDNAGEDDAWTVPLIRQDAMESSRLLARLLARQIRDWLDRGDMVSAGAERQPDGSEGLRPMHAGDIMVLVRRRGPFVEAFVKACKSLDVPVAGVDRIKLTEQLAVMDVLALCRFLLLPDDDLTLATVLKSPLLGLDEDGLFHLAQGRPGTLWSRLQDRARRPDSDRSGDQALQDRLVAMHGVLSRLLEKSDFLRPFELLEEILTRQGGRARLLARLGEEARDPLDELLTLALQYEQAHTPSLQGFLHWLYADQTEIKRDQEQAERKEVRIMTVHGAKGLQAPVVILPDTLDLPNMQDSLFWAPDRTKDDPEKLLHHGMGVIPLWSPRQDMDSDFVRDLREKRKQQLLDEYQRLLYVALTRAEDRLYIAGHGRGKDPVAACWYQSILAGLDRMEGDGTLPGRFESEEVTDRLATLFSGARDAGRSARESALLAEGWSGSIRRYTTLPQQARVPQPSGKEAATGSGPAEAGLAGDRQNLPDWLMRPAGTEAPLTRPLSPSLLEEDDSPLLSPLQQDGDKKRFQRGLLIHRLLQSLPDLPRDRRPDAALRYLSMAGGGDMSAEQQEALYLEVAKVLEDPAFAPVFAPGSRAEVAVTGLVDGKDGPRPFSGQIDRLSVTPDRILVVDYKTNRPPPKTVDKVSVAYRRQMAAYRALLQGIWPDREIRCALLWTNEPFLMPLPDHLLDGL